MTKTFAANHDPEIDARFGPGHFVASDAPMLATLGIDATPEWLECTNNFIAEASQIDQLPEPTRLQRRLGTTATFSFLRQLGWTNPSHEMYGSLERHYSNLYGPLISPQNAVRILRILGNVSANPTKILRPNADIRFLTYRPEVVQYKIDALAAEGLDVQTMLATRPSILNKATSTMLDRVHLLRDYASILDWQGDSNQLIERWPTVLTMPPSRLNVLAAIAADHLSSNARRMTQSEVITAMIRPLQSHLAAIALDDIYVPSRAKHYQRIIPARERLAHAQNLLTNPDTAARISPRVRAAYRHYLGSSDAEVAEEIDQ